MVLAGNTPIELQAGKLKAVYLRKKEGLEIQSRLTVSCMKTIRKQEHEKMMVKWRKKLIVKAGTGRDFNMEILSCMKEWVCRGHGELTYEATQLITGHGCFKGYTHRIGKTEDGICSFCRNDWEDFLHVLFDCSEWREEREVMKEFGGTVESLGALMRRMLSHPQKWRALLDFAVRVIERKSEVEREEQAERMREKMLRDTEELLGGQRICAGQSMGRRMVTIDHIQ